MISVYITKFLGKCAFLESAFQKNSCGSAPGMLDFIGRRPNFLFLVNKKYYYQKEEERIGSSLYKHKANKTIKPQSEI